METEKFDYIMLGDSITQEGNWNELLGGVKVINKGIGGDTSAGVLNRFDRSINESAHTVFVMIGINDLMLKRTVFDIYRNYIKIIEKLLSLNKIVIVQSTLFVGERLHQINPNINLDVENLNIKLSSYCHEHNIKFLDINKAVSTNNILKDEYSHDSVHINNQAYIKWAKIINDEVFGKDEMLISY
jgi:lysophospholipase L1-like esterase